MADLASYQTEKIDRARQTRDFMPVRQLAVDGYASNAIRLKAWQLLIDQPGPLIANHGNLPAAQVREDTNRSMFHIASELQEAQRALLTEVILEALQYLPRDLTYTQGFHAIGELILGFAEKETAVAFLVALGVGPLRPFLKSSGLGPQIAMLDFLKAIVATFSPALGAKFAEEGVSVASNWLLFWGLSGMRSVELRTRYLDFFAATHPLMIVYFIAAVLQTDLNNNVPDSLEEYFAATGGTAPFEKDDFVGYFNRAIALFQANPPSSLLQAMPVGGISRICETLIEDGGFRHVYPDFPLRDRIPQNRYLAKLPPAARPSRVRLLWLGILRQFGWADYAIGQLE
jgi:hypothetical protein